MYVKGGCHCTQALVKCCMPDAASELEEDLTGLLEALARIFDPGTFFHQHNKNQDVVGGKVRHFSQVSALLNCQRTTHQCRLGFYILFSQS